MTTTRSKCIPLVMCLALALAACGSDGAKDATVTTTAAPATTPETVAATTTPATSAPATSPPATSATATTAPDTVPDGIFEEFVLSLSADGWLVDPAGRSIYVFNNDVSGSLVSACTGGCASTWPPVIVSNVEELGVGEGFAPEEFDFIYRDEGIQLTYFGSPLYYYAGDSAPGDQLGEGVGGVWYLAFYGLGG